MAQKWLDKSIVRNELVDILKVHLALLGSGFSPATASSCPRSRQVADALDRADWARGDHPSYLWPCCAARKSG